MEESTNFWEQEGQSHYGEQGHQKIPFYFVYRARTPLLLCEYNILHYFKRIIIEILGMEENLSLSSPISGYTLRRAFIKFPW